MNSRSALKSHSSRRWDAIVIGTGIGGATLGHALAKAGRSVLFCESGAYHSNRSDSLASDYPEHAVHPRGGRSSVDRALLARAGRYQSSIEDVSGERTRRFVPFIGEGAGGSSALYGMAMERLAAIDFFPVEKQGPAADPREPSPAWPLDYQAFGHYYSAAERLYRVRGARDPLSDAVGGYIAPPPPLSEAAASMFQFFEKRGLHPYPLPTACEFVPGCQCCQGYLCARECKNDSARICLRPAVDDFGADVLDDCRVLGFVADRKKVDGVVARIDGADVRLRADKVFLAAGALQSPNILLRSNSGDWPRGLANGSGLVGRNLMRHCVDLYAIVPEVAAAGDSPDNRFKEFAFKDFYSVDGVKLGSVQSFGRLPPASMLFDSLKDEMRAKPFPGLSSAVSLARPFVLPVMRKIVEDSLILATIMEDMPYADNRVWPADNGQPGDIRISYRLRSADRARVKRFRSLMSEVLPSRRWRLLKQAENNERIAHACGTCRFGDDPATSVLDRNNRCHELENLYVVDGSFFPSSGGTNPSLTIAANALRVAEHVLADD